jgi:hypothetical protein
VTCDRSVVFSGYFGFHPPIKLTSMIDITEILLKVALNTIEKEYTRNKMKD